jgi:S-(hydroxymethyl)glutathione dehydrogenase / alcohol dehydrogenase
MPTDVGHRRHLGVFHRFINLAESGWLDLASIVSRRIKRDEVNDGIALTARADGVRIVIV